MTSSLEALKAYTLGDEQHNHGDDIAAMPFYKQAIDLDPNFAMAYARLATAYLNTDQLDTAQTYYKKAYELRDRASERERFYITAHYFADTGQIEKGIQAYELYKQTYPRDNIPWNNLANLYETIGQFDKVVENAREAVRLNPTVGFGHFLLAGGYMQLGRLDEAKTAIEDAKKAGIKGSPLLRWEAVLRYLTKDQAGLQQTLDTMKKTGRDGPVLALALQRDIAISQGKFARARELSRDVDTEALRLEAAEPRAAARLDMAELDIWLGHAAEARQAVPAALQIKRTPDLLMSAGFTLLEAGDLTGGMKLVDEAMRAQPINDYFRMLAHPAAEATVELERRNPQRAIELLEPLRQYDGSNLAMPRLRARAYVAAGRYDDAIRDLEHFAGQEFPRPMSWWRSVMRVDLARAYVAKGDKAKARTAYQNFFSAWKDADPDIPLLKQAKDEYAKLQ
jgi:tetratricopeptide (TPR) repeat protein